jgi:hypothetical protein
MGFRAIDGHIVTFNACQCGVCVRNPAPAAGDGEGGSSSSEEQDDEEGGAGGGMSAEAQAIEDATQTNLVNLRRTIYLTIMSSLDFEEVLRPSG